MQWNLEGPSPAAPGPDGFDQVPGWPAGAPAGGPAAWQYPPPPPPPAYGGYAYPARPHTNGFSVAALVLGIAGIWPLFGVGSVLGLIFGLVGLSQIKRSQGTQSGKGMAIAGIILGSIGLLLVIIFIVVIIPNINNTDVLRSPLRW